jgi:transcription elongation factor SPT5
MSEDEIENYFKKKYAVQPSHGDERDEDYDDIAQHSLLPSTKDPNLWIVKCRMGEEKSAALQLMRKFFAYEHTDEVKTTESILS